LASNISTVNLQELANATNNYSGADIAEIVRMAIAEAVNRIFNVNAFEYLTFFKSCDYFSRTLQLICVNFVKKSKLIFTLDGMI
jgi:SpoVK/Ycf46/Vps4 family AAA+-type ATPase